MLALTGTSAYRWAVGLALVTALMLIWLSLGVGIIGKDGDPSNRMYFAVIGIGGAGSVISRFRARGMARTLLTMGLAQALITAIALVMRLGWPWSGPAELILLNGLFIGSFAVSAKLFQQAHRADCNLTTKGDIP